MGYTLTCPIAVYQLAAAPPWERVKTLKLLDPFHVRAKHIYYVGGLVSDWFLQPIRRRRDNLQAYCKNYDFGCVVFVSFYDLVSLSSISMNLSANFWINRTSLNIASARWYDIIITFLYKFIDIIYYDVIYVKVLCLLSIYYLYYLFDWFMVRNIIFKSWQLGASMTYIL